MPDLALGQAVRVVAILERVDDLVWQRRELPEPVEGFLMGYRNRNNGRMDSERDEYSNRISTYYVPMRGFKAALVSIHLYRKPVVALPDDVHPLSE